jgi:hypothetical protein
MWGSVVLWQGVCLGTRRMRVRFSPVAVEYFLKIEFVIFLSPWSLGSEIRHLALLDNSKKQEVLCVSYTH